ncbi:Rpn family recombination-promoting nuclease/putative transposase [uncultured Brachyspira sp.]|uniref:Rpn family recombination-promoting nuclease/putative transposase n=1 Tax=uncultured Brachyspira sp. TaxID=221953 RepID=UPI002608D52C|nr:Rpn family recombination-promoting nuclease/putative transposase [uncultured Brachyspira sp.]
MNKINLLNDFFIRYLLACEGDEDILENIVNSVLINIGFDTVHNLEIINPYNIKDNQYLKESILDVKAKTRDNKKIIIEFQLFGNIDFLKRIYYYISKNIALELKSNEAYKDISKIISINFLNFNLNFDDFGKEHRCFKLIDTNNHNISLDMVQIHLIEIKRFKKILEKLNIEDIKKNKLLSWIEFFTSSDLNKIKNKLKEENYIMSKVIEKYDIFTSDEETMQMYNAREAFLYGQEIMLKREREEGIKEGIEKEKYDLAKNMKNENLDINLISKITGLSTEEISKL